VLLDIHLVLVSLSLDVYSREIDCLVRNIHNVDDILVRFLRHDRAKKIREITYNRKIWILMLGFPLNYMHNIFINQVVSSLRNLLRWHNSPKIK
jgi:hypothetical protein